MWLPKTSLTESLLTFSHYFKSLMTGSLCQYWLRGCEQNQKKINCFWQKLVRQYYVMLCYVMLYYVMLCFVLSCYAVVWYRRYRNHVQILHRKYEMERAEYQTQDLNETAIVGAHPHIQSNSNRNSNRNSNSNSSSKVERLSKLKICYASLRQYPG